MRTFIRRRLGLVLQSVLAFGLCLFAAMVVAQTSIRDFDHLKTGFPLGGAHTSAKCESCHLRGVFRGTPRDCATCHAGSMILARNNVVKPANHIPTAAGCENCHTAQTFTGARFNHAGVSPGTCVTCHNGVMVAGKTASHFPTPDNKCDTCHKSTTTWNGAKPDHSTFTPATNCASCHNG